MMLNKIIQVYFLVLLAIDDFDEIYRPRFPTQTAIEAESVSMPLHQFL